MKRVSMSHASSRSIVCIWGERQDRLPVFAARIAQVNATVDAATDDAPVGKLGPVPATHDAGIACANIQSAVRIAAERVLFFEPIHRG
jgi:hypothetical protein